METASFQGVIKTLFYIILFYYVLRFAFRLLMPILVRKAVQKAEENLRNRYAPPQPDSAPSQERRAKKQVGEYVEFEEID